MTKQQTLGFIGIGLMGKPLTIRLLRAGFHVNVWNRTKDKLTSVVDEGAIVFDDLSELANASDVIILCLANTEVVESIVENELFSTKSAGKLVIDLSSIHPETTKRLAQQLKKQYEVRWVDAPVSGGTLGAERGTLAIMAGGEANDIAIAKNVLQPLYTQLTHMGELGSGQVTKICNQMIVSCNVMVIAEMMALAKKSGVDATKIPQALAGGFADSKPLQITGSEMATEIFEPIKWRVQTLLKDLTMAIDLSYQKDSAIPMSKLATQLMQQHGENGFLEQDPATLIKLFTENSDD